jgi:hypothetical protein
MAIASKVLGQSAPAAATETTLYTVPSGSSTIISTILVCNTSNAIDNFNVSVSVGGSPTDIKDYIYNGCFVLAHDTFAATIGITLGSNDVMRIYSNNGSLSFSLFGQETS